MAELVGIDLGTTNTVMAYLDESGDPKIQVNTAGENLTPSAVHIDEQKNVLVGTEAIKQAEFGFRIWTDYKRDIGNDVSNNEKYGTVQQIEITPEVLSTFVLRKLKHDFETARSSDISNTAITYPANFADKRREASLSSGKLADWPVGLGINEPSAAALYFAMKENLLPGKYAIYDFGGGTWDISIIEVEGTETTVVDTSGIVQCGGKDFDEKLKDLVNEKFMSETGVAIEESLQAPGIFEGTKKSLSIRDETNVAIRQQNGPPVTLSVTRAEFESAISTLIAQTEIVCSSLFTKYPDIVQVLLVGGSTRVPAVKQSVEKTFGKTPLSVGNPDEVVALGAAIYAGLRAESTSLNQAQSELLSKVNFNEIANHYLGVSALQLNESSGNFESQPSYIINKGTKIPCTITEPYYTVAYGQENVKLEVLQASIPETDKRFVNVLWEGNLPLPSGLKEGERIDVTFEISEDGVIHCSFSHEPSGRNEKVSLSPQYELNEAKKSAIEAFFVE
jgi:molecular chaperone DnaK